MSKVSIRIIDRRKRPGPDRVKHYGELLKDFLTGYLKFHDFPPHVIVLSDDGKGGLEIDYDPEYDPMFNHNCACCSWMFEMKKVGEDPIEATPVTTPGSPELFGADGPWK